MDTRRSDTSACTSGLYRAAKTLGCGANLWLARTVSASFQGLRGQAREQLGLDSHCLCPPAGSAVRNIERDGVICRHPLTDPCAAKLPRARLGAASAFRGVRLRASGVRWTHAVHGAKSGMVEHPRCSPSGPPSPLRPDARRLRPDALRSSFSGRSLTDPCAAKLPRARLGAASTFRGVRLRASGVGWTHAVHGAKSGMAEHPRCSP